MDKKYIDNLDVIPEFGAVYDPLTLSILKIGQKIFLDDDVNIIDADFDLAMKVITGDICITKCYADLEKFTVKIIEEKSLTLIEDILHRIPDIEYSKYETHDILVTIKNNSIIFELNSELGGTYQQSTIKKLVTWNDTTKLNFLLTAYNDPHIIYNIVEFSLSELIGKYKLVTVDNLPDRFSIFTNRLFKSYAIKNENN